MAETMWLRRAHFGQDRRGDSRMPCVGATLIDVLSPHPQSSVQVRVVDVTASGLKLVLPFFLSAGAVIRIHMTEAVAYAEVRYCTCDRFEYCAGVVVGDIVPKCS